MTAPAASGQQPENAPPPEDFDARLARARSRQGQDAPKAARPSLIGFAFRIATELVAGVLAGGLIGWLLDRWLGTFPWATGVFCLLGVAAGFINVIRHARQMNAEAARAAEQGQSAPPARDEEED